MININKVVAIYGGGNKKGITKKMFDYAIKCAQSAGHTVKRIELYSEEIKFCRGCLQCREENSTCVLVDSVERIKNIIEESDIILIVAPVYFANVPGILKCLFDRLNSYICEPRVLREKSYIFLTACNTPFLGDILLGQSRGALRAVQEFFKLCGVKRQAFVAKRSAKGCKELTRTDIKKIKQCFAKGKDSI